VPPQPVRTTSRAARLKVFWFFFSKKNILASLADSAMPF
jgi:hypothetical protein